VSDALRGRIEHAASVMVRVHDAFEGTEIPYGLHATLRLLVLEARALRAALAETAPADGKEIK
jgi:hypothetical protein